MRHRLCLWSTLDWLQTANACGCRIIEPLSWLSEWVRLCYLCAAILSFAVAPFAPILIARLEFATWWAWSKSQDKCAAEREAHRGTFKKPGELGWTMENTVCSICFQRRSLLKCDIENADETGNISSKEKWAIAQIMINWWLLNSCSRARRTWIGKIIYQTILLSCNSHSCY